MMDIFFSVCIYISAVRLPLIISEFGMEYRNFILFSVKLYAK